MLRVRCFVIRESCLYCHYAASYALKGDRPSIATVRHTLWAVNGKGDHQMIAPAS